MGKVQIFNETNNEVNFDVSTEIADKISNYYGVQYGEISFIILSDEELLEMNKNYLGHDWLTDVITFDLSEETNIIEGEIYCSYDRILENGEEFGEGFEKELKRVFIHGFLHLCGEKDYTKQEKENIHNLENKFLELN